MFKLFEADQPDPTNHRNISFVKSAVRIVAGVALIFGSLQWGGALIIVAEIIGVVEEMV